MRLTLTSPSNKWMNKGQMSHNNYHDHILTHVNQKLSTLDVCFFYTNVTQQSILYLPGTCNTVCFVSDGIACAPHGSCKIQGAAFIWTLQRKVI